MPGQTKAPTPKRIAHTPRRTSAHQFCASVLSIAPPLDRSGSGRFAPRPASPPGLAAPPRDLRPDVRKSSPRGLPASVLALHQEARDEAGSPARRLSSESTEPRLGDHRVLMLAEDVLQLLHPIHEPLAGVTDLAQDQLRGIASALGLDPHRVELLVGGRLR